MGQILYGQANAIRAQGEIDAARITQKSGNELEGAKSALARFNQELGNKRLLKAAGDNINAITENIGRNLDAATYGDFMTSLAASEELGASAAAAAAAGIGGSSVEAYNDTVRLNYALQGETTDRSLKSDLLSSSQQRGAILTDAVARFDNNVYAADLDFKQYVDVKKPSTFGNIVTLGLAAGATYFGGPAGAKAASAIISAREAQIASSNGDFAGAAQATNSALGSIMGGIQTANKVGIGWGSVQAKQAKNDIVMGGGYYRALNNGITFN